MSGQVIDIASKRIHESQMLRWHPFNKFLDDLSNSQSGGRETPRELYMIPIGILNASKNMRIQFLHERDLLIGQDAFHSLMRILEWINPKINMECPSTF